MLDKRTTYSARFMHRIMTAMMIVLALLIFPSLGGATIFTVSDGNDIQNVIDAAADFDTIRLVGPELILPEDESLTVLYKNITFIGDDTKTTVRGNGNRVFDISLSTVTMENLIITGGDQVEYGAGIAQYGGSLILKNCEITQNGSKLVESGGGLDSIYGSATILNCHIDGNQANTAPGISVDTASVTIKDSTITNNTLLFKDDFTLDCEESDPWYEYGGGVNANFSSINIKNTTIEGNNSIYGGGLGSGDSALDLTGITVTQNNSYCDSGGIFSGGGVLDLVDSTISLNTSSSYAGGVHLIDGVGTIRSTKILSNHADSAEEGLGGGLFLLGVPELRIDKTVIQDNTAGVQGGGLYMMGSAASIFQSTISGNDASNAEYGAGGGIYTDLFCMLEVSTSTISGNTATLAGGGLWVGGLDMMVEDFASSSSFSSAAALKSWSSALEHADGSVHGTRDPDYSNFLTMENSTVSGNSAQNAGGGLVIGGQAEIDFCTITDNASDEGGGIFSDQYGSVAFGSNIVAGNVTYDRSNRSDWFLEVDPVEPEPLYLVSSGGNLIGDNSGSPFDAGNPNADGDIVGSSVSPLDPLLEPLGENGGPTSTHALNELSPAIDFAVACIDEDQRGYGRPFPENGNCDAGAYEAFGEADLSLSKTVDDDEPLVGEQVTYTLTLDNNSGNKAYSVSVTDLLPASLVYVSHNASGGDYNLYTGKWTIGFMDPGESQSLTITVLVTQSGTITNTATVDSGTIDPTPASDQAEITATVAQTTTLTLTKTVNDDEPAVGDNIVYTVAVTNSNQGRAVAVNVVDLLPAGLTYQSHDADVGTYNHLTGIWDVGDLAVSETQELEITARVDLPGTITNTATAFAANSSSPAPTAQADIEVDPDPTQALYLIKTVNDPTPLVGDQVVYTLSVVYFGDVPGQGIVVTDQLPAGVTYISDDGGGDYTPASGEWAVGTMQPTTARQLKITVLVNQSGQITNEATADAASTGVAQVNASADLDASEAAIGTLTMTKTVDNQTPTVGEQVVFTLVAANSSQNEIKDVRVIEQLPNGLTYESDNSGNAYDPVTGVWTIGDLPAGESRELNITVTPALVGVITNTATIYSASGGAIPATGNAYVTAWEGKKGSGGGGGCFIGCQR